nr:uncharacterized mitochondrial protein AtMg00810-like [Setaria viridis]
MIDDMSREFEMSMMGELTFFLGLQIKQSKEGTFVHQGKYTKDVLRKFDMADAKPLSTPMGTMTALDADEDDEPVDQKKYRSMIGSLLYLTATRPDIHFVVCLCARFQASPRTSHHQAVKRIMRKKRSSNRSHRHAGRTCKLQQRAGRQLLGGPAQHATPSGPVQHGPEQVQLAQELAA